MTSISPFFTSQGVCIGLSEVMGSSGRHQLLSFMNELIPTIRTALCDRSFFWFYNFFCFILISNTVDVSYNSIFS
jgi:hypothetical protein